MKLRVVLAAAVLCIASIVVISPEGAASDSPPCVGSVSVRSSVSPPSVFWPCPGRDPTYNGVVTTRDITGDGIAEVAIGIIIPSTGAGIVFLVDGATGAMRWYTRVTHGITRMTFLDGPNYVLAESWNWGSRSRGDSQWYATVYALSLWSGGPRWSQDIPYTGKYHRNLIVTVPDIDADGVRDIVAGTDAGVVTLSGASGALLWQAKQGNTIHQVAGLPDIDGDGIDDILATTHTGPCVMALSGATGSVLWRYITIRSTQCVMDTFDIDRDGKVEVVVGLTGSPSRVLVLEGRTGHVRVASEVDWPDFHAMTIVGSPDLNGDGVGDMVLTNATWGDPTNWGRPELRACANGTGPCPGTVSGYSGKDASLLWSDYSPIRAPDPLLRLPGESPTFVTATGWGTIGTTAEVYRLDANGRRMWTYEIGPFSSPGPGRGAGVQSVPYLNWKPVRDLVLGPDIDGSGTPDILAISDNLRTYAIADSGYLLWAFLP